MLALAAPAFAATYDPLDVIPYDTWRASSSMTAADIQTFLAALPGPLKSLVIADYAGVVKPASQIIWDAAHAQNLNPKIILATLQKEQSLLTVSNSSNAARLVKAMGCGVWGAIDPKTGLTTNRSPGFGHQIWDGANKLSTYEITYNWFPGKTKTVTAYMTVDATKTVSGQIVHYDNTVPYDKTIVPANASTFALYTYTPYYPQRNVWDIYVRYFGDPHAPARLQPVYRFRNRSTGAYYYTSSEGTRYSLIAKSSRTWVYGGVSFTIDTSSTANTQPLYRLSNIKTHRYTYTAYKSTRDAILRAHPHYWRSAGTVGYVSTTATGGTPVYRMENKKTRAILYTQYASSVKKLTTGKRASYWNKGVAFYLGRSDPAPTPVGP
ncbi:MAG TPA: hypothetical protein VIL17_07620 [Coriobacteriia bacterium]